MMIRKYMRPVISTCFRPSSRRVVLARICVAMAEKTMCQHVRNIAVPPPRLATGSVRGRSRLKLRILTVRWRRIEVLASTPLKQGRLAGMMGRYSRNPAVSINHLLKRIVRFEKNIYVLQRGRDTFSCYPRFWPGPDRRGQKPTGSVARSLTRCKRLGGQDNLFLRLSVASQLLVGTFWIVGWHQSAWCRWCC